MLAMHEPPGSAGFGGPGEIEQLAAMLVAKNWVDPRNVCMCGVVLVGWCSWQWPKAGAGWVEGGGAGCDGTDHTCAPLMISPPAVMQHYITGLKKFEVRSGATSAPTRALCRPAVPATRGTKMYLRCNEAPYAGWLLELEVKRVLK